MYFLSWGWDTNYMTGHPDWTNYIGFQVYHVVDSFGTNVCWGTNDAGVGFLWTNTLTFLTNWQEYVTVTGQLSCTMSATQNADLFKIRTVDTRFGIYSGWATNQ